MILRVRCRVYLLFGLEFSVGFFRVYTVVGVSRIYLYRRESVCVV